MWLVALSATLGTLIFALPANHDVGWLLHLGRRILDGARPYMDFVEINPLPAIILETGVASLERLSGFQGLMLHDLMTILVCCASAAATVRVVGRRLQGVQLTLFGTAVLVALLALPGYDAGQREHLSFALLLPYLTALGIGEKVSSMKAALAAIGVALKPHMLLLVVASELVQSGRTCRHLAVLLSVLGILAASSVLAAPAYLQMMEQYAPAYRHFTQVHPVALAMHPATLLIVIALLVAILLEYRAQDGQLAITYGAAGVGAVVSLLIQGKGFTYHFLPAECLALLAGAAALVRRASSPRRRVVPLAAVAAVLLGVVQLQDAQRIVKGPLQERPGLTEKLATYPGDTRILGLTWALRSAFPVVTDLGLEWVSPYSSLWVISGARAAGRPDLVQETLDRIYTQLRSPPELILLDTAPGGSSPLVRLRALLSGDPRYDTLLSHYRIVERIGRFEVLELARPTTRNADRSLESFPEGAIAAFKDRSWYRK